MDTLRDLINIYENIGKTGSDRFVIIIRGTSGAGKSTFANLFADPKVICTADDFFYDKEGNYNFDPKKLGQAHGECQNKFECALQDESVKLVIVANTNVKPSDYQYYIEKANEYGLKIISVVLEKRHANKSVHNVPDFVLQRQHDALKNDLKLI
jgi:predicted kinase